MVEDKGYRPKNPGHFGPDVIGEEQFEREREIVSSGSHVFGPSVLDSHPATDEEGNRQEPDRTSSPTAEVPANEGGFVVGQFEFEPYGGGWYHARHVANDLWLDADGELITLEENAKSFGPGKEQAREKARAFLRELGHQAREVFRDQEAGPAATEANPEDVSEAELTVREAAGEKGYLGIEEMQELLEGAGDTLRDRIIDSEFAREDGVRLQALADLIGAEKGRDDGPRATVLNRLERAYAQATAGPPGNSG